MKATDLAKLSGVTEPTISRYRSGDQLWVDPEDLSRLAKAISNNPAERAELIRARLLDECKGPGADLITIEIRGKSELRETPARYGLKLSKEFEEALQTIREWIPKDNNVKEIVQALSSLLREAKL